MIPLSGFPARASLALAICLSAPALGAAGDVQWRVVVASANDDISLPQLPPPSSGHFYQAGSLADARGSTAFRLRQNSAPDSLWSERGGILLPYAEVGAGGAKGPGRSGDEGAHVFSLVDAFSDGIDSYLRVFGARAGPAGGTVSTGLWTASGSRNTEIARLGSDGPLGPGLGAGWTYQRFYNLNVSDRDYDARMLRSGRVLISGAIAASGTVGSDALSLHTPGAGNYPCMLVGSTDASLAPGIVGATFSALSSPFAVSPTGAVHAMAAASGSGWSGSGIWRFCHGAPKLAVLTGVTDEHGPGMAEASAVFGGDPNGLRNYIAPGHGDNFYFSSGGRMSVAQGAPTFFGLFHHANGRNAPRALQRSEGEFGPQVAGYVFNNATVPWDVKAAGRYAALSVAISPVGNLSSTYHGIWRIAPGQLPEPVAIAGDTGAFSPGPGMIWGGTFYRYAVYDNGDIITLANVKEGSATRTSLWRLSPGKPAQEILKPGDPVAVPAPTGTANAPVAAIDAQYSVQLPPNAGRDTWFSADGQVMLEVRLQGYGNSSIMVRGTATRPGRIFTHDFD